MIEEIYQFDSKNQLIFLICVLFIKAFPFHFTLKLDSVFKYLFVHISAKINQNDFNSNL